MNDLRTTTGSFFLLNGAILIIVAIVIPEARAPLTTGNVNLYAGLAMLLFGGVLFWLSRRPQS
jgi:hypothetical protein